MTYVALPRKRLIIKAVGDLQETRPSTNVVIEKKENVATEKFDRPSIDEKTKDSNTSVETQGNFNEIVL